jgi:glutamyl-tRNA reductase
VAELSDVYLYTVDDLSTLVQTAGEKRQAAVQQAEAIIDAGVQSFEHWLDQRAAVPLIQALNRQADDWGALELARARKALARGENPEQVLEALARGITSKMLHGTLAELHAADGDERERLAHTVQRIFLRQGARPAGGGDRGPDRGGERGR